MNLENGPAVGTDRAGAEADAFSEVQEILTALYETYRLKTKKRRVSDNAIARWLGVSPSNWNYWINGTRLPGLENALVLAPKIEDILGIDQRERFMLVLGYPNYQEVRDSRLQYVHSNWSHLSREAKEAVYALIQEELAGGKRGSSVSGGGKSKRDDFDDFGS